jgi:L-gulonate 3-dehydrogenase
MKQMGIVGGGSIGVAFAVTFARARWHVRLFDPAAERRAKIVAEVRMRLDDLEHHALLDEHAAQTAARVDVVDRLESACREADLIEECAPEQVEIKRDLFAHMDRVARPEAVLASASSFLCASRFVDTTLPGHARCLVANPGNPPYLLPIIEIVPAPFTSDAVTQRAIALFADAGLEPVHVAKETEGFIFNRLQGAVLREAYCLVRDGIGSVEDIDRVMRAGLGMRWSVTGPFETVDLNTRGGIASHARKMGPSYLRMGAERGQQDVWMPDLIAEIESQRRALLSLDEWETRVAWRDRELMKLLRCRLHQRKADAND